MAPRGATGACKVDPTSLLVLVPASACSGLALSVGIGIVHRTQGQGGRLNRQTKTAGKDSMAISTMVNCVMLLESVVLATLKL